MASSDDEDANKLDVRTEREGFTSWSKSMKLKCYSSGASHVFGDLGLDPSMGYQALSPGAKATSAIRP